ncbi:MAG TPA: electron transport complex subunit RsxC [Spirochaetota bacterium]|nr:electron transport complex subunit RsxC [Spirochaetota bacterium]HOD13364.1 electron transport complex subunit RsxC [Spirochaetota bacterium]HPG50526.1 electron transport complex subunit RsxC [Spirochaetota bacterium]HPN11819.1 electron transport complex subunit RsxC [Spirochaetota bacterium]HQL82138.1 electron transport complex subunit RsxC [Spirochaetota bacterium]
MFSRFGWGVHPPESKAGTKGLKFINLPIPHTCYIPLQQHVGAPARLVVNKGDLVSEGQLIGSADGAISAHVHSSIPGKVADIAPVLTVYGPQTAVIIEAEGSFSASARQLPTGAWTDLSGAQIRDRVRDAGVVGLGGAAFPTAVKLSPPEGKKIDTLVVNGAECEPYLTVDDMLMQTFPEAVIEGTRIALAALGIGSAVIGVENNKKAAVSALKKALAQLNPRESIAIKKLRTRYPQGAEKQMIASLLGRRVPSGGLPMDVGVIVQNVGTILAIRDAVAYGMPLFSRYMTVAGKAIARPGNYKVRLGMRLADIVEECGGFVEEPAKIVMGGPMCGVSVPSLDMPVVKGTSGVLFLTRKEATHAEYTACIRCGACVAACPMNLLPCDLGNAVEKNRPDLALKLNPRDCIMCGCCSYVCPSRRPLSHFIKLAQERTKPDTVAKA